MATVDLVSLRAEMEAEREWREAELRLLRNQIAALNSEDERRIARKWLVVMLYAHFEGVTKALLSMYVARLNTIGLKVGEVTAAIGAASLEDMFKAMRDGNKKCPEFVRVLPDDTALHRLAREREFVEVGWKIAARSVPPRDRCRHRSRSWSRARRGWRACGRARSTDRRPRAAPARCARAGSRRRRSCALAGRLVEVSGYAFLLRTGVKDGRVTELVVMPPSMSGCCGPACTPVLEKLVFVDCSASPLPRELWQQAGVYARFTGVLGLSEPGTMDCLFTLRDARARLYEVDTGAARACLIFDGTLSPPWRRPNGT